MTSIAPLAVIARMLVIAGLFLGAVVVPGPSAAAAYCGPPVPVAAARDVDRERWRYVDPAAGSYHVLHANRDAVTVAMWFPGCITRFHALVSLDPASGEERWRLTAPEIGEWGRPEGMTDVGPKYWTDDLIVAVDGVGNLVALDMTTGAERWRQPMPADVRGVAGVAGDTMIAYDVDMEGVGAASIMAIGLATGTIQWRTPISTVGIVFGSPAVAGSTVVVLDATASDAASGLSGDTVIGLDLATGQSRWIFDLTSVQPALEEPRIVAVRDETVLITDAIGAGSEDSVLLALDVLSGAQRWRLAGGGEVAGVDAGVVVTPAASDSFDKADIVGLDETTGAELWRSTELAWVHSVAGGLVVGPAAEDADAASLRALDLETGKSRWLLPLGDPVTPAHGVRVTGIVPDGDRLYAEISPREPKESGVAVIAIDARAGEPLWSAGYPEFLTLSIRTIADGVVYAQVAGFGEAALLALNAT